MGFESRGQGLGSTFFFELPLYSATTAGVCPTTSVNNAPDGHRLSHSSGSTVNTIVGRQVLGSGDIDVNMPIVDHLLPTSGDLGAIQSGNY
jgi:hypothetical protein